MDEHALAGRHRRRRRRGRRIGRPVGRLLLGADADLQGAEISRGKVTFRALTSGHHTSPMTWKPPSPTRHVRIRPIHASSGCSPSRQTSPLPPPMTVLPCTGSRPPADRSGQGDRGPTGGRKQCPAVMRSGNAVPLARTSTVNPLHSPRLTVRGYGGTNSWGGDPTFYQGIGEAWKAVGIFEAFAGEAWKRSPMPAGGELVVEEARALGEGGVEGRVTRAAEGAVAGPGDALRQGQGRIRRRARPGHTPPEPASAR